MALRMYGGSRERDALVRSPLMNSRWLALAILLVGLLIRQCIVSNGD